MGFQTLQETFARCAHLLTAEEGNGQGVDSNDGGLGSVIDALIL
jgi:hypothetical protein